MLSSAVNIVEVWDKDAYEKSISGEDVDFDLAEDVMGNKMMVMEYHNPVYLAS